jgi:hypothetical protein
MSRRIFATVERGPMDKTAVCIFPWELQILQHVHGGSVKETSIDELCSMEGAAKVEKIKPKRAEGNLNGPSLREQYEIMVYVDPEQDPALDPAAEYARLSQLYGMDADLPMLNVSRIYGEFNTGNFERLLATHAKETAPKPKLIAAMEIGLDNSPDRLSVAELRDALDAREVKWVPTENKATLVKKLEGALVA